MVKALQADEDLNPAICHIQHPVAHILNHLRVHGAPIWMKSGPWTRTQLDAAVARGSHQSAALHQTFLADEMLAMIQKGQWIILPYSAVANIPNLWISPLGVVPQHDHWPCTIADYTFSGVNADTIPLATHLALQFGQALLQIIHAIVQSNPAHGPVYMIKLDLADGFYHIHIAPADIPHLGVSFPMPATEEAHIAFPLALPMGWTSSPPIFCAATETITNLANAVLVCNPPMPPHHLESLADTTPLSPTLHETKPTSSTRPLALANVFVDDHIALAQGNGNQLRNVCRHLLTAIDKIFCPLANMDHHTHQEPVLINTT